MRSSFAAFKFMPTNPHHPQRLLVPEERNEANCAGRTVLFEVIGVEAHIGGNVLLGDVRDAHVTIFDKAHTGRSGHNTINGGATGGNPLVPATATALAVQSKHQRCRQHHCQ